MTSKTSKAKRRAIPLMSIADLERAGRLSPNAHLVDAFDRWLEDNTNSPTAAKEQPLEDEDG
jgi:hypothetical protein